MAIRSGSINASLSLYSKVYPTTNCFTPLSPIASLGLGNNPHGYRHGYHLQWYDTQHASYLPLALVHCMTL